MYLKDCTFAGHLCDVRIAWQRPGRPAHRVRPVWPVLPPPLCQRQGKQVQLLRNADAVLSCILWSPFKKIPLSLTH